MKRLSFMLLLVVILTMISVPVSAQTVNGVCVSNTFTCGVYQQGHYLSIYGSNMPTGNGPGNTLVIVSTSTSCNDSSCREVIRSSSGTQTYGMNRPHRSTSTLYIPRNLRLPLISGFATRTFQSVRHTLARLRLADDVSSRGDLISPGANVRLLLKIYG